MSQSAGRKVDTPPRHVAIIMDGNGRWAEARGQPRSFGHKQGAEAVRRCVRAAAELNVGYLTLFGFSTENWRRSDEEVGALMDLLRFYLRKELAELHKQGARLRVIGERSRFAPDILELIERAEAVTRDNDRLHLTVALNYGGRQEIVEAARSLARDARDGGLDPDAIDMDLLAGRLFTSELPDPDLLIRTSGERRISNFLLWQAAYAEFVFLDTLWPDFSRRDLEAAIADYHGRDRRFGAARSEEEREPPLGTADETS